MDDILCRGLCIDTGKMVYGTTWSYRGINFISTISSMIYKVESNTVGAYLGFEDKNNKEVFDGDILMLESGHMLRCKLNGVLQGLALRYICSEGVVIGNIHTHPELVGECDA